MFQRFLLILLSIFLLNNPIKAQSETNILRSINYIISQEGVFSSILLTENDLYISSSHKSSISGIDHIYFQQTLDGIDILNALGSVHFDQNNVVARANNNFLNVASFQKKSAVVTSADQAISVAANLFNLPRIGQTVLVREEEGPGQKQFFSNQSFSRTEISVRLIFIPIKNELILTREVVLDMEQNHEKWAIYVDAGTNEIVEKTAMFLDCDFGTPNSIIHKSGEKSHPLNSELTYTSLGQMINNSYNVYAIPLEAPHEGARSIVVEPWNDAPTASPFGWHDINGIPGAEFTNTNGNNVLAVDDLDGNNSGGNSPDGTATLTFDFLIDLNMSPGTYINGAITNLFYMNNIMHDVTYQYGFDAGSGNFQVNNYGNGGTGSDAVRAEAQDGSDTNNARFFSAPEGISPRMEMYQWIPSVGSATIEVTAPGSVANTYASAKAAFGPQTGTVSGIVVLADASTACNASPITNGVQINGNIAMIDRGGCTFVEKVLNAQTAGAVAVIICNNIPGDGVFSMGGSNPSITIPSAMLSFEDCELLRVEVTNGLTADLNLIDQVNRDSDLDNGIIAHEYGHGISIRLTGGPQTTGCLSGNEQMGEGWSDYFALMFQLKPGDEGPDRNGIGTYVQGDVPTGGGIRPFPYSTDFAVNPMTYNTIASVSIPHGVGSVWCTMLWDMTWNLIEKHGYESDIYETTGGNGIAMQLVMEGLKLQNCMPGFVDGRDAILLADTLMFGAENSCEIWRAFARRGLGVGADQGSVFLEDDGIESYNTPSDCPDEAILPCTDESLVFNGVTIPDNTDSRANTNISILESNIDPGSNVMLRAGLSITVDPLFEISETGELFLKAIPCDDTVLFFQQQNNKSAVKSGNNKNDQRQ